MKRPYMKSSMSVAETIISSLVHKDDYLLYQCKQIWDELSKVVVYAKESTIEACEDGGLFIKSNNSVIKNELLVKKDEIRELINVYLHSKSRNDKYPVKRVIIK